jgi:hypothetical protein
MPFLDCDAGDKEAVGARGAKTADTQRSAKLMHRHGNPNGDVGETLRRNTALQMTAGSFDDLSVR